VPRLEAGGWFKQGVLRMQNSRSKSATRIYDRIPWHPAFVQAMRLELEPYTGVLEFISEHQLTSEPQKIDLAIIKKTPGAAIDKNIAQAFRDINILEYKSPEDSVSAWDFHKVLGYAV
jgi:hypothetical protein